MNRIIGTCWSFPGAMIIGFTLWMGACSPGEEEKSQRYQGSYEKLKQAAQFLIQQQAPDGAWRSQVHGILKEGQAYTPYVLETLLSLPDSVVKVPDTTLRMARSFILSRLDSQGALGLSDPLVLEYPNYATAFALKCLVKLKIPEDSLPIRRMQLYLQKQQFDTARGVSLENPAYGAWGFGETNLGYGYTGHVDLSHTRKVLDALRASDWEQENTYQKARWFLSYSQKRPEDLRWQGTNAHLPSEKYADGGFYYSPVLSGANKAGVLDTQVELPIYRSYATATCEGLLALIACGYQGQDPEVQDVIKWMRNNAQFPYPAGISPKDPGQWHQTLALYHMSIWAEAAYTVHLEGNWPEDILGELPVYRSKSGSYFNQDGARNKENDPILGTCLAIRALWGSLQELHWRINQAL